MSINSCFYEQVRRFVIIYTYYFVMITECICIEMAEYFNEFIEQLCL